MCGSGTTISPYFQVFHPDLESPELPFCSFIIELFVNSIPPLNDSSSMLWEASEVGSKHSLSQYLRTLTYWHPTEIPLCYHSDWRTLIMGIISATFPRIFDFFLYFLWVSTTMKCKQIDVSAKYCVEFSMIDFGFPNGRILQLPLSGSNIFFKPFVCSIIPLNGCIAKCFHVYDFIPICFGCFSIALQLW